MLTPRYFFAGDFSRFSGFFFSHPHRRREIAPGALLWEPGRPMETIHYILSGVAQNEVEHENGHRKIVSFHGPGTLFPGYHRTDYQIELALVTRAVSPMEVLEFSREGFGQMLEQNPALDAALVEWYAMYVNLLLYETAHQEYNSSFLKLCNLLYLLADSPAASPDGSLPFTQEELAGLLGVSRVNLTRGLSELRGRGIIRTRRRRLEIADRAALAALCLAETLPSCSE